MPKPAAAEKLQGVRSRCPHATAGVGCGGAECAVCGGAEPAEGIPTRQGAEALLERQGRALGAMLVNCFTEDLRSTRLMQLPAEAGIFLEGLLNGLAEAQPPYLSGLRAMCETLRTVWRGMAYLPPPGIEEATAEMIAARGYDWLEAWGIEPPAIRPQPPTEGVRVEFKAAAAALSGTLREGDGEAIKAAHARFSAAVLAYRETWPTAAGPAAPAEETVQVPEAPPEPQPTPAPAKQRRGMVECMTLQKLCRDDEFQLFLEAAKAGLVPERTPSEWVRLKRESTGEEWRALMAGGPVPGRLELFPPVLAVSGISPAEQKLLQQEWEGLRPLFAGEDFGAFLEAAARMPSRRPEDWRRLKHDATAEEWAALLAGGPVPQHLERWPRELRDLVNGWDWICFTRAAERREVAEQFSRFLPKPLQTLLKAARPASLLREVA